MEKITALNLAEIRTDCPIDSETVTNVKRLVQPGTVTYCQVKEIYADGHGAGRRFNAFHRIYYMLMISNWHALTSSVQTLVLLSLTGAQVMPAPREYNPTNLMWDEIIALE